MLAAVLAGMILLGAAPLDREQQARLERLGKALLAPCCYQEVVATHTSEVARQMREELAEMVAAGRSEREILDYYKQRYGTRVLAEPEGAQWWVMNVVPVAMLAAGAGLVVHLVRKWRRGPASTPA
jgi:cytochrome c-type biogenesis protein CcmH